VVFRLQNLTPPDCNLEIYFLGPNDSTSRQMGPAARTLVSKWSKYLKEKRPPLRGGLQSENQELSFRIIYDATPAGPGCGC